MERIQTQVYRASRRPRDILFEGRGLLVLIGIIAIAGVLGFVYLSGFFSVAKVAVSRSSLDIPADRIETAVRELALGQNIFRVDTLAIAEQIKSTQPDISHVVVRRELPRGLVIEVFKFPAVAVLRIGGTDLVINENGFAIPGALPTPDLLPLQLAEQLAAEPDLTRALIPLAQIAWIREAARYAASNLELKINSTNYLPTAREAHLQIQDGPALWLDLDQDFRPQLDKLQLAKPKLPKDWNKLDYFDLRIRNKIFYQ